MVLIGRTQYGTRDGIRLSLPSTQGMRLFVARMDVLYCYCLGERGRILQGSLLSKTESGLYASNSVPQAAKDFCAVRRRCYLTSGAPRPRSTHNACGAASGCPIVSTGYDRSLVLHISGCNLPDDGAALAAGETARASRHSAERRMLGCKLPNPGGGVFQSRSTILRSSSLSGFKSENPDLWWRGERVPASTGIPSSFFLGSLLSVLTSQSLAHHHISSLRGAVLDGYTLHPDLGTNAIGGAPRKTV